MFEIAVAIPTHPARLDNGMMDRATKSVYAQTLKPAALSVAVDWERHGAPATRQRALDAVSTSWVAFLDSDDMFDPDHLELLARCAEENDASYVYSYWHGPDVLGHFGKPFNPAAPVETTITILVKTELAKEVGFRALPDRLENTGEDFHMLSGCVRLGAKIVHLPRRTWTWSHHGANSSGMPTKGDAAL